MHIEIKSRLYVFIIPALYFLQIIIEAWKFHSTSTYIFDANFYPKKYENTIYLNYVSVVCYVQHPDHVHHGS